MFYIDITRFIKFKLKSRLYKVKLKTPFKAKSCRSLLLRGSENVDFAAFIN